MTGTLRQSEHLAAWINIMKRVAAAEQPANELSAVSSKPKRARKNQKEPFWTDSIEPEYYYDKGLRKVRPYYFEYMSFVKQRWLGRTILDVFQREFRDRPSEYYEEAIKHKLITINGNECGTDYLLKASDTICHKIHRHEPPVADTPVQILHEDAGMLVVNKPPSIAAHPSGRYRFNSLTEILRHDRGYEHVSLINRLDRPTSGIVLLALNKEKADELHRLMTGRHFRKTYIARVKGQFSSEPVVCKEPLLAVEHKLGLVAVSLEGKEAETRFTLLKYLDDYDESIVMAEPFTGRTHQIRVHLQFLGHPISNDNLYNNPLYCPGGGLRSHKELKGIAAELLKSTFYDEMPSLPEGQELFDSKSLCPECESPLPDPEKSKLGIFLHAFRYAWDDRVFQTLLPDWVPPDLAVPEPRNS